ncbi:hypothetical protein KQI11_07555 [Acetanaerobacterium sp. MSJ-12]|uniref:hypothetical protein n=1 Tax=Acetanaerobacterium sp. MSJ-12 TaxID=2841535 RepID=UPI001C0F1C66|nr:hypothetical protein [Acetanaerobacterium sp. MSJ-12]MBU5419974.1 hypothetical protein [Acetanaerobacterium sp. MSJ-12]
MLKIDNAPAARRWIDQMSGDCTAVLGPKRRKRSLDANAYLWALCDQIAKAIRSTKEEVYCAAIKRVGVVDVIPMREDAAAEWCHRWRSRGIGWVVETADAGLDGWVEVLAYWGSSTYSAAEMSRLLDDVIEEAKELGIETATPEQLALMREEWGR